jgi:hypothetical protein
MKMTRVLALFFCNFRLAGPAAAYWTASAPGGSSGRCVVFHGQLQNTQKQLAWENMVWTDLEEKMPLLGRGLN